MSEKFMGDSCKDITEATIRKMHEKDAKRCSVCGQVVCMCRAEFYQKTKKERIEKIKKACKDMTKEQLIGIIVEFRLMMDERIELGTKRQNIINKLLDEFVPVEKRFVPIYKDDKMFCPTCNVELEAGSWKEHFSGPRKVGSAGFNYVCPICGFSCYKAFGFRD